MSADSVNFKVGDRVIATTKEHPGGIDGVCSFLGETSFAPGVWVGVILNEPVGKNNGTIKDRAYFACPENHGIFVKPNTVRPATAAAAPATPAKPAVAAATAAGLKSPTATPAAKSAAAAVTPAAAAAAAKPVAGAPSRTATATKPLPVTASASGAATPVTSPKPAAAAAAPSPLVSAAKAPAAAPAPASLSAASSGGAPAAGISAIPEAPPTPPPVAAAAATAASKPATTGAPAAAAAPAATTAATTPVKPTANASAPAATTATTATSATAATAPTPASSSSSSTAAGAGVSTGGSSIDAKLQAECTQLRTTVSRLQAELEASAKRQSAELATRDAKQDALEARATAAAAEAATRVARLESDLAHAQQDLEGEKRDHAAVKARLAETVGEHESILSDLRERERAGEAKLKVATQKLEVQAERIATLQATVTEQASRHAADATAADEVESLRDKLNEQTELFEEISVAKELLEEELDEAQTSLLEAEDRASALEAEVERLKTELANGGGGSNASVSSFSSAGAAASAGAGAGSGDAAEAEALVKQNRDLTAALVKLRDMSVRDKTRLETKLAELQTEAEASAKKAKTNDDAARALKRAEGVIVQLQEQLADASGTAFEAMVEELTERNLELEEELARAKEQATHLLALHDASEDVEAQHAELERELQQEVDDLHLELTQRDREAKDRAAALERAREELRRLKQLVRRHEEASAVLRAEGVAALSGRAVEGRRQKAWRGLYALTQSRLVAQQKVSVAVALAGVAGAGTRVKLDFLALHMPTAIRLKDVVLALLLSLDRVSYKSARSAQVVAALFGTPGAAPLAGAAVAAETYAGSAKAAAVLAHNNSSGGNNGNSGSELHPRVQVFALRATARLRSLSRSVTALVTALTATPAAALQSLLPSLMPGLRDTEAALDSLWAPSASNATSGNTTLSGNSAALASIAASGDGAELSVTEVAAIAQGAAADAAASAATEADDRDNADTTLGGTGADSGDTAGSSGGSGSANSSDVFSSVSATGAGSSFDVPLAALTATMGRIALARSGLLSTCSLLESAAGTGLARGRLTAAAVSAAPELLLAVVAVGEGEDFDGDTRGAGGGSQGDGERGLVLPGTRVTLRRADGHVDALACDVRALEEQKKSGSSGDGGNNSAETAVWLRTLAGGSGGGGGSNNANSAAGASAVVALLVLEEVIMVTAAGAAVARSVERALAVKRQASASEGVYDDEDDDDDDETDDAEASKAAEGGNGSGEGSARGWASSLALVDELRDACTGAVATLLPKLRSLSAPVPTSAAGAAASDSGLSALALLARDGDWTLGNATAALPALMQWLGAAAAPGTLLATGNSTAGSAAAVCAMRTPATTAAAAAVEAAGAKLLTAARALLRLAAAAHVRTCVAGAAALPALSIESDEAPEDTASAPLTGLSVKERRRAFAAIATGPRSLSTSPEAGSGDVSAAASREPPSVVWWLTRARSTIAHVLAAAHELTEATRAAYTANCAALAAATAAAEAEAAAAASAAPAAAKTETSALPGIKPAGASATATASAVVTLQVSASTWVEQGPWAALAGATEARAGLEQAAAANAAAEAARGELEQRMSELFEAKRALKDATARGDALQAALASASASAGGVTVTSSPGAATDTNGAAAAGAGGAGTHAAAAAGRSTLATGGEDAVRKTVERLRARETEYQAAVKALQGELERQAKLASVYKRRIARLEQEMAGAGLVLSDSSSSGASGSGSGGADGPPGLARSGGAGAVGGPGLSGTTVATASATGGFIPLDGSSVSALEAHVAAQGRVIAALRAQVAQVTLANSTSAFALVTPGTAAASADAGAGAGACVAKGGLARSLPPLVVASLSSAPLCGLDGAPAGSPATGTGGEGGASGVQATQSDLLKAKKTLFELKYSPKLVNLAQAQAQANGSAVMGAKTGGAASAQKEEGKDEGSVGNRSGSTAIASGSAEMSGTARGMLQWSRREQVVARLAQQTAGIRARVEAIRALAAAPKALQ